ncbi:hypothetical protein BH11PSE9_BH11PSE9_24840 [soil metagenome]
MYAKALHASRVPQRSVPPRKASPAVATDDTEARLRSFEAALDDAKNVFATKVKQLEQEIQQQKALLARMRGGSPNARAAAPMAAAANVSETARVRWVQDGLLTASNDFARQWGISRQALDQATDQHKLFSVKVGRLRYYPTAFLDLKREDVAAVCNILAGASPEEKLVFWLRPQGALDGRSVADALKAGSLERVMELAAGFAEERGLAATHEQPA